MAQTLKQIKSRVRSVQNTSKVTSAMELIAASKLNRVNKLFSGLRTYNSELERILYDLVGSRSHVQNRFFEKSKTKKKAALCVITSDSGLCGLYNNNIITKAEEFIQQNSGKKFSLILIGKKGLNYFRRTNLPILYSYVEANGRYDSSLCDNVSNMLVQLFLTKKIDEAYVAYTHCKTMVLQEAMVVKFLNLTLLEKEKKEEAEFILEPDFDGILDKLISKYITIRMRLLFLCALKSEHSARAIAMKTATDNADELLDELILSKNKARQASITQEIMEIVSSAEALQG